MLDTGFSLLVSADTPKQSATRAAEAVPAGGIFYYALGGGMGHLMRAHAIARAFTRLDPRSFVTFTNARFAAPELPIRLQLEGRPQPEELTTLLRELLAALRPSGFVVDAFPAGILGELTPLLARMDCRRTAILRRLQSGWVEKWELPRVLAAYDNVALIEPGARFAGYPAHVSTLETPTILARDAWELLSPADARATLEHEGDAPLVVAAITGEPLGDYGILRAAESHLQKVYAEASLRLAVPMRPAGHTARSLFPVPLMEALTGVDLVIGACGYNLAHETAALGVPAIFLPQRRTYDDQLGRAQGRLIARSGDELEEMIRVTLSNTKTKAWSRSIPQFANGAEQVAALISGGG